MDQVEAKLEQLDSVVWEKVKIRLAVICALLHEDWHKLASSLYISEEDVEVIKAEYAQRPSQCAIVMLRLWLHQQGVMGDGSALEQALHDIGRADIVEQCLRNLQTEQNNVLKDKTV